MKILISGFEAFHDHPINPTSRLVESLAKGEISFPEKIKVDQIILPVSFSRSFSLLEEKIIQFAPDIIISLGVSSLCKAITLEEIAVNSKNSKIPDNEGLRPQRQKIIQHGEESYVSTLPLTGIKEALNNAKIPVELSQDAGRFVCNSLFYQLLHATLKTHRQCGFIHVPRVYEYGQNQPSLEFEIMKDALSVILHYFVAH